jgi:hypothetical protein
LRGRHDIELVESQIHGLQVANVPRNDESGSPGNGQLDQVVVALVAQVGSPRVVDMNPASAGEKDVEEFFALCD